MSINPYIYNVIGLLILLLLPHHNQAKKPNSDKDNIRVKLFQKLEPTEIVIASNATLIANGKPLINSHVSLHAQSKSLHNTSITFTSSDGFVILAPQYKYKRTTTGSVTITSRNNQLQVFLTLPLQDYLAGVIDAELGAAPLEALKAQAIVSRTYAMLERQRHGDYDFCDLTHCQVFKGVPALTSLAYKAAKDTKGLFLLTKDNHLAQVVYSSTCGGKTAWGKTVWGHHAPQYLVGILDVDPNSQEFFCATSPHSNWQASFPITALYQKLHNHFNLQHHIPPHITIQTTTDPHGWISRIHITGLPTMSGEEFHMVMGRLFGWQRIKSAHFIAHVDETHIVFKGQGLGHGVGLCQYGAMQMATQGYHYEHILNHYFPQLHIGHHY